LDASEQRRRGPRGAERFDARTGFGEGIERDIDAIEIAIILGAILQVIDDLQGGAERVVGRPGGAAFAMDVEHEAADRHGGIGAVADQVVPVAVAQLGYVHAERGEQVLGVTRRQRPRRQLLAQPHRDRIIVVLAEQARLEPIH
jgi:hypothetical protein